MLVFLENDYEYSYEMILKNGDKVKVGVAGRGINAAETINEILKEVGEINTGEVFTKETEYKKGGRVKKNKGGLIRGIPKLAMRGY